MSTSGLSSAYQLTEVTGALTVTVNTGGALMIGWAVISPFTFMNDSTIKAPEKVVEIVEVTRPSFADDEDPARAEFAGPLGSPATHEQLAQRLQNYRVITEEVYDDIAEGLL